MTLVRTGRGRPRDLSSGGFNHYGYLTACGDLLTLRIHGAENETGETHQSESEQMISTMSVVFKAHPSVPSQSIGLVIVVKIRKICKDNLTKYTQKLICFRS